MTACAAAVFATALSFGIGPPNHASGDRCGSPSVEDDGLVVLTSPAATRPLKHVVFVVPHLKPERGDVTTLTLPGGVTVRFSGHDVRHADGRQLQRVGLVPDLHARPTLEGVRAGRDEVLEHALVFLRTGK